MTYNLQDFKTWLEADETRKEGLNWTDYLQALQTPLNWSNFVRASTDPTWTGNYSGSNFVPYRKVFEKFLAWPKPQIQSEITLLREILSHD